MKKLKIGVVGCGMISEIYLKNMTTMFADVLEVIACADISAEAASKRAEQFGIQTMDVDALIAHQDIELIVNLTIPASHYDISKRALMAGKHAYSEKPLAATVEQGKELVALAKEKGLLVASAPDTFLGAGLQTCLKLIDEGAIGTPVGAQGFMIARGPESFHPNPAFLYAKGAGPLLDMGPYYFTALAALFGPAERVNGLSRKTFSTRKALSERSPIYGQDFSCEVDTFISGGIQFQSGVIASLTITWDLSFPYWNPKLPLLIAWGTEGTLVMPDPNTFGGVGSTPVSPEIGRFVQLRKGAEEFMDIPLVEGFAENSRGLGVADMARAVQGSRSPRVNGDMALHVLEMMQGMHEASRTNMQQQMQTSFAKPPLLDVSEYSK